MGKITGNVIAMYNRKGGVAKTASTIAFAGILERLGKRVLVFDLDDSFNCSTVFKVADKQDGGGLFHMICENVPIEKTIKFAQNSMVDVIPSGNRDFDARLELTKRSVDPMVLPYEVYGILKKNLARIEGKYDYILMDCSPSRDILSECILAAATDVITPVDCDKHSYEGVEWIYDMIQDARERYNPTLNFVGVLITKADIKTSDFKRFYAAYNEELGEDFILQPIRREQELKKATNGDMPIFSVMRRSYAKGDYIKAACEIGLIDKDSANRLLTIFAKNGDEQFEYTRG